MILNIPMPPTPNAKMHLGHMAGPYLAADMINRALKYIGEESVLISGFDSFEDWVSSKTPDELESSIQETRKELSLFAVDFDQFVLPNQYTVSYQAVHRGIFNQLIRDSSCRIRPEQVFSNGKIWGFNAQIKGKCKNCGYVMTGYACPGCYQVSEPWELQDATAQFERAFLQEVENYFMVMPDGAYANQKLTEKQADLVARHLSGADYHMRLTYQGSYGIFTEDGGGKVIRNHFYMYCVFLRDLFFKNETVKVNAFMGLDNLIPCGVSAFYIDSILDDQMSLDRVFTNEMLFYNHQKFSKTTGNGPTLAEIKEMNLSERERSSLRVYLASLDLENKIVNFDLGEYQQFHQKYEAAFARFLDSTSRDKGRNTEAVELLTGFITQNISRAELVDCYFKALQAGAGICLGLMSTLDPIGYKEVVENVR